MIESWEYRPGAHVPAFDYSYDLLPLRCRQDDSGKVLLMKNVVWICTASKLRPIPTYVVSFQRFVRVREIGKMFFARTDHDRSSHLCGLICKLSYRF